MAGRKAKPPSAVVAALQKEFGVGSSRLAREGSASDVSVIIPTGLEVLDYWILGCGGLPGGRIIELYADAGAGKTSLGFQFLASAQDAGGVAVLIETERTLDLNRAHVFGVDIDELVLFEPDSFEDVLEGLRRTLNVIPKGSPSVVVWDSLAATELAATHVTTGKKAYQIGKGSTTGKRARLTSEALPLLATIAAEKGCAVIIINQIRDKIGVMFGDSTTTPGGHAPKFHSTIRLQLWRGAAVKKGTDPVGIYTTIKATKNKLAIPFRKAKLRLDFATGFDDEWSLMHLGKERSIVSKDAKATEANLDLVRDFLQPDDESEEDDDE